MTVPIARVVATRYATAEPPLRFCYFAHAYRAGPPAPRADARVPAGRASSSSARPAPEGTAEALTVLCRRARRRRACAATAIGLGDASLYPALLRRASACPRRRARAAAARARRRATSSASSARSRALGLGDEAAELLVRVPQLRGGPERARRDRRRRRPTRCAGCARARAARRRRRRARDLRPRPRPRASATTRARSSRSTTRRSARRSAAAGATTTCSGASAAPLPAVGFALERRPPARRRWPARSAAAADAAAA